MVGIYKITSPSNKVNIGQSWNITQRKQHYSRLECKGQPKLYNSLLKHGWDNHEFEIIYELPKDVTQEILDNYEIFYWQLYKDCGFEMLNIKEPGRGGKWSKKMKEKFKENRNKPEWKQFLSKIHTGKKVSKETRQKQSNYRKGKIQTEDIILKRGIRNKRNQQSIDKMIKKLNKPIVCIETNENFNSIKEASIKLNLDASGISKVCRKINKTVNNLTFKFQ